MVSLNIKGAKYRFFSFGICFLLSSCDFNVNDSPGDQMSMSIKEAKRHGTFICEYKIKGGVINGVRIKTVFAERKFLREDGLLLRKRINCCESQLVIVSTQPLSNEATGYDFDWKISGFESPGTFLIYKDYNGILFPDSIPITVVAVKGKDSTQFIEKRTLYKIK